MGAMTDERRRAWTLVLCCLAQFMVILDVSIVNVALPSIAADLGFTPASLAWVVAPFITPRRHHARSPEGYIPAVTTVLHSDYIE